jgi:aryl-alcohol dehydrogenase-like predicted oxidoreductase
MELKSSGKIEKIGISLKNPKMLKQQQDILPWDAIQFNCSILDQRVKEFSKDIEKLRKNGVELIARTPLNFGFLGPKSPDIHNLTALHHLRNWPKAQLEYWRDLRHHALDICKTSEFSLLECALRFPIDSKLATIVIPGATNSRELKENIQAFQRPIPLDLVTKFQNCLQFLQEFDSPYKIQ